MRARLLLAAAALIMSGTSCLDSTTAPTAPMRSPVAARRDDAPALQLLSCPADEGQQATGLLGLLGGTLSLGGNSLHLPLGGLLSAQLFQVVVPASQYMEVDVHAVGLTSFLFQRPATITIDYSRCADSIPEGAQLHVVYIDSDTKAVLEDMGGADDSLAHRITFSTPHLSGYAVAYDSSEY